MGTNTTKHYMEKLKKEMDNNEKDKTLEYVKYLAGITNGIFQGAASRIINVLLVSNGGAVVAILAFYGSGMYSGIAKGLFFPLNIFGWGLVFTLLTVGFDYLTCSQGLKVLSEDGRKFYKSKIVPAAMLAMPNNFVERTCNQKLMVIFEKATRISGLVAFVMFIFGAINVWLLFSNHFNSI